MWKRKPLYRFYNFNGVGGYEHRQHHKRKKNNNKGDRQMGIEHHRKIEKEREGDLFAEVDEI